MHLTHHWPFPRPLCTVLMISLLQALAPHSPLRILSTCLTPLGARSDRFGHAFRDRDEDSAPATCLT